MTWGRGRSLVPCVRGWRALSLSSYGRCLQAWGVSSSIASRPLRGEEPGFVIYESG